MTSNALADVYATMSERMAANPEMPLATVRAVMAQSTGCASEPAEVSYEEVNAGGVPSLWIKPQNARTDRVILYFHGGGFVVSNIDTHRKMVGHLAKASKMLALLIDYRLAPEHAFPAAMDDASAAYKWLQQQGFKGKQIVTMGDSAGGNMAVTAALKARLDGMEGPVAAVSLSPWFDLEAGKSTSGSMKTNETKDKLVHGSTLDFMAQTYLQGASPKDPMASPLYSEDLKGLPPVYIAVSKDETLYDDSVKFAELARKAGVEIEMEEVVGQQHVHEFMAGKHAEADKTIANVGRWLQSKA